MKQALRVVGINFAVLCTLLVGLELSGQILFRVLKGYPVYESDRHAITRSGDSLFELHPYLAGRLRGGVRVQQGEKIITITAANTRWTGAADPPGKVIRVALLGGSTTFGSGVTDSESWAARLQALLGQEFAVTNFGVPGYSTAEAIIQMGLIVPEVQPDLIVLYEGWNDIRNYHEAGLGTDYYGHGMRQYTTLGLESPEHQSFMDKLVDVSALGRLALVLARSLAPSHGPAAELAPTETRPDPFVDRIYLRNLATLKLLAQNLGAYTIFVPQVLDQSRFRGAEGSHRWTPHIENAAMPGLISRFNGFMNQVCAAGDSTCVVLEDVLSLGWDPADFVDEGHFSAKGSATFAERVAAQIRESVARQHLAPRDRTLPGSAAGTAASR